MYQNQVSVFTKNVKIFQKFLTDLELLSFQLLKVCLLIKKLAGYNGNVDTAKADGTDAAVTKTTAGGGLATFDSLPLGAYVVTETKTPAGYVGSKPFIITVPMTHPTDLNKWVYDVHAYPKNSKANIEKTVKYLCTDHPGAVNFV